MARCEPASAATVGRNEIFVAPSPWSMTTGGPDPASVIEIGPAAVATCDRRSPLPVVPAVAARKPIPRCRS